jgi:hypothetical protein
MSATKTERVVVCLSADDRSWLDRETERRGLNASTFIRMTLRREREREALGLKEAVA